MGPTRGFQTFVRQVFDGLAAARFPGGLDYLTYVSQSPDFRRGDEADVVDQRITPVLLDALGYTGATRLYNAQEDRERPDFRLKLHPTAPDICLWEDKATTEVVLGRHLAQLTRYLESFGVARGVLCNGDMVIGYEGRGGTLIPLFAFSLRALMQADCGQTLFSLDALPDYAALEGFFLRFARDRLVTKTELVEDLIFTKTGALHARDGGTWPQDARFPVLPATAPGFLGQFTDDVRSLLGELAHDAHGQLVAYEATRNELERAARTLPDGRWVEEEVARLTADVLRTLSAYLHPEGLAQVEAALRRHSPAGTLATEVLNVILGLPTAEWQQSPDVLRTPRGALNPQGRNIAATLDALETLIDNAHARRTALFRQHDSLRIVTDAFSDWQAHYATVMMPDATLEARRHEFAVQTAYVLFVRLLLVRIAEDKALLGRRFTNGGMSFWLHDVEPYYVDAAQGASLSTMMHLVFQRAQEVYRHFFAEHTYDWYHPDGTLVLHLLHRLAHYDFGAIDQDIIGHLYTDYVSHEHRHQSGMYYTPPTVVDHILDRVGYDGAQTLGRRVLDPACGSGTFLVRAARRMLKAWTDHLGGTVPPDRVADVLRSIQESVFGLDLNPFACYLAEINLLMQVMDLLQVGLRASQTGLVDRFHIYTVDALLPASDNFWVLGEADWPLPERIKAGRWPKGGFDYVVGNPPYVRADEPGLQLYRARIKEGLEGSSAHAALVKKWDLFVPFVALGISWLGAGGRLGMIVSDSIEVVPYAQNLRRLLLQWQIRAIDFFPDVFLFADAAVHSTIVAMEKSPGLAPVERAWHDGPPPSITRTESRPMTDGEALFRHTTATATVATVTLGQLCYVTKGMVLHAVGKPSFVAGDLVAPTRDVTHPVPYVEGKDVDPYVVQRVRWLEYGSDPLKFRAPHTVYRPTFSELWDRQKLLIQISVGDAVRLGQAVWDGPVFPHVGFATTNHTTAVAMRWCDLEGVNNRSIDRSRVSDRTAREAYSRTWQYGYLAAVINSSWATRFLRDHRTHAIHIFPEVLKTLPIPEAPLFLQDAIGRRVLALQRAGGWLQFLRQNGWQIESQRSIEFPPPVGIISLPVAEATWGLHIVNPSIRLMKLRREERSLWTAERGGKLVEVARLAPGAPAEALDWFVAAVGAHPEIMTWDGLRSALLVPRSPSQALDLMKAQLRRARGFRLTDLVWRRLDRQLDHAIAALYGGDVCRARQRLTRRRRAPLPRKSST